MSSKTLICFDASIRNNTIGIGVWDSTNKQKVYKSLPFPYPKFNSSSSDEAERMALITTLQYIQENNIKQAFVFTDNLNLYNEGISKELLRKYTHKMDSVSLFWIPREFNTEADYLSKKGSEVNKTPIASMKSNTSWHLKNKLREFPLERKIHLLKRLAINEFQMDFIECIENKTPIPQERTEDLDNKHFVGFTSSIIMPGTSTQLDTFCAIFNKRPKIGNTLMEKLIRDRDLI